MINYDEEIKKFSPSLDIDQAEDAIYNANIKDITDVVLDMLKEFKENEEKLKLEIDKYIVNTDEYCNLYNLYFNLCRDAENIWEKIKY